MSDRPPDDGDEIPPGEPASDDRAEELERQIRERQQGIADQVGDQLDRLAERIDPTLPAFRRRAMDRIEEALAALYGAGPDDAAPLGDLILESTAREWEAVLVAETRAAVARLPLRIEQVRAAGDTEFADLLEMSRQAPRLRLAMARQLDDTRSWVDPRGYRLSQRIWGMRQDIRDRIDQELRLGLARGDGPDTVARRITAFLDPTASGLSGRRGGGTHAAMRLARTEMARARAEATVRAASAIPTARGVRWTISNNHPRVDVCDEHARADLHGLGPGGYPLQDRPQLPAHPWCRCRWSTIFRSRAESDAYLRRKYGLGSPSDLEQLTVAGGDRPAALIAAETPELGPDSSRVIGLVPEAAARHWESPTRLIRMTGSARDHFLANRPGMANYYAAIIETVRDPDEIHTYIQNPRRASFWRRVDPSHHIHVAIDMTDAPGRANEVVTAIYSRDRELARKRRQGLKIWERGEEG